MADGPVRLSDTVIPEVYMSYGALNSPEKTEFWQAGLIATSSTMTGLARTGGATCTMPFWKDLDPNEEPNYSNDDPADKAKPGKVGTGKMKVRKAFINKGYSTMDLVQELTGSAPMEHIRSRFGVYWQRQWQRRLIASTLGVMRANKDKNSGDMIIDISAETGELGRFNSDAVIDLSGTMGDAAGFFGTFVVHSRIRDKMLKDDDIEFIPNSEGKLVIPTYKGRRVVVDDSCPIISGTGKDAVYMSTLFGQGAFGFGEVDGTAFALGEGIPKVAVEIERDAASGNGSGEEVIWERKTQILHPLGMSWDDLETDETNKLTEFSPTLADLAKAAHWSRVVDRKNMPMAFLLSKG